VALFDSPRGGTSPCRDPADKLSGVVVGHIEGVTMVLLFCVFSNSVSLLETKVIVIW